MQVIDNSTSLRQLKQFLQNLSSSSQIDPYWQSILQSDIRNIIPKHEVSKIQLVKTNLSKIRIILQNVNNFISLQIQKKHLKQQMIDLSESVTMQLQQLTQQQKTNNNNSKYHYDSNIAARRKQLQQAYKQFTRNRTSSGELKSLVGENKKWTEYIDKNVKVLQRVKQNQLQPEITNFISTFQSLFNITPDTNHTPLTSPATSTLQEIVLKSGAYTKMYENKIRERVVIQKLVENVYQQISNKDKQLESGEQEDYWARQQVKRLRQAHNI